MTKDRIVRAQVIHYHTFLDEMLASAICRHFFGRKRGFIKLWKTKRFRLFNYYVIEVLSLTEKLRLVRAFAKIPRAVAGDIEMLNALRNGMAHAFFPQNVRSAKPVYKGRDSFTVEGSTRFDEDMQKLVRFLLMLNVNTRNG